MDLAQPAPTTTTRPSDYASLVEACCVVVESYSPDATGEPAYLFVERLLTGNEWAGRERLQDPEDASFIVSVVEGMSMHYKLLDTAINLLYELNPVAARRSDRTMFSVVTYLALFRLRELGWPSFRKYYPRFSKQLFWI